ncbi:hypothetical protein BT96DRAFT_675941 [Gymnopus androsaceus JB14]|uniref:Uncharacterized protein n=1 Tax=Gymnopus androsaceus JB14 TaxID=1447944 RepID=A0A6A4HT39_9AGAR|nr:hypothetical protein BT96DRAFT_675941 [Gymnopus androsaceus JB14]
MNHHYHLIPRANPKSKMGNIQSSKKKRAVKVRDLHMKQDRMRLSSVKAYTAHTGIDLNPVPLPDPPPGAALLGSQSKPLPRLVPAGAGLNLLASLAWAFFHFSQGQLGRPISFPPVFETFFAGPIASGLGIFSAACFRVAIQQRAGYDLYGRLTGEPGIDMPGNGVLIKNIISIVEGAKGHMNNHNAGFFLWLQITVLDALAKAAWNNMLRSSSRTSAPLEQMAWSLLLTILHIPYLNFARLADAVRSKTDWAWFVQQETVAMLMANAKSLRQYTNGTCFGTFQEEFHRCRVFLLETRLYHVELVTDRGAGAFPDLDRRYGSQLTKSEEVIAMADLPSSVNHAKGNVYAASLSGVADLEISSTTDLLEHKSGELWGGTGMQSVLIHHIVSGALHGISLTCGILNWQLNIKNDSLAIFVSVLHRIAAPLAASTVLWSSTHSLTRIFGRLLHDKICQHGIHLLELLSISAGSEGVYTSTTYRTAKGAALCIFLYALNILYNTAMSSVLPEPDTVTSIGFQFGNLVIHGYLLQPFTASAVWVLILAMDIICGLPGDWRARRWINWGWFLSPSNVIHLMANTNFTSEQLEGSCGGVVTKRLGELVVCLRETPTGDRIELLAKTDERMAESRYPDMFKQYA